MKLLTLPWDCVLHDNHRLMPALVGRKPRLITSPDYRLKKREAELRLAAQWRAPLLEGDVALHALVYVPDLRKRDAGNYRKLITDALTEIAYADDSQLVDERWTRAGLDRTNPRVEILVSECSADATIGLVRAALALRGSP